MNPAKAVGGPRQARAASPTSKPIRGTLDLRGSGAAIRYEIDPAAIAAARGNSSPKPIAADRATIIADRPAPSSQTQPAPQRTPVEYVSYRAPVVEEPSDLDVVREAIRSNYSEFGDALENYNVLAFIKMCWTSGLNNKQILALVANWEERGHCQWSKEQTQGIQKLLQGVEGQLVKGNDGKPVTIERLQQMEASRKAELDRVTQEKELEAARMKQSATEARQRQEEAERIAAAALRVRPAVSAAAAGCGNPVHVLRSHVNSATAIPRAYTHPDGKTKGAQGRSLCCEVSMLVVVFVAVVFAAVCQKTQRFRQV